MVEKRELEKEEIDKIVSICERFESMNSEYSRMENMMDLMNCQQGICELNLDSLMQSSDEDFMHDINGIKHNLDRLEMVMLDDFLPRYAKENDVIDTPLEEPLKKQKTQPIPLEDGKTRNATIIEDLSTYRGHYFEYRGKYFESNFNVSNIKGEYSNGYSMGYELTHGSNVIEHLFNKLGANGIGENGILSEAEKIDFHEKVNPLNPNVQYGGEWYDFSEVLCSSEGVLGGVWTLDHSPSDIEIEKVKEHLFDGVGETSEDFSIRPKKEEKLSGGIVMGATRNGELSRTAEVLVEMAEKYEGDPLRVAMESLYMLRSTARTEEDDLKVLQEHLDEKFKKRQQGNSKNKDVESGIGGVVYSVEFDVGLRDMVTSEKITPQLIADYANEESPNIYNAKVVDGYVISDTDFYEGKIGYIAHEVNLYSHKPSKEEDIREKIKETKEKVKEAGVKNNKNQNRKPTT